MQCLLLQSTGPAWLHGAAAMHGVQQKLMIDMWSTAAYLEIKVDVASHSVTLQNVLSQLLTSAAQDMPHCRSEADLRQHNSTVRAVPGKILNCFASGRTVFFCTSQQTPLPSIQNFTTTLQLSNLEHTAIAQLSSCTKNCSRKPLLGCARGLSSCTAIRYASTSQEGAHRPKTRQNCLICSTVKYATVASD